MFAHVNATFPVATAAIAHADVTFRVAAAAFALSNAAFGVEYAALDHGATLRSVGCTTRIGRGRRVPTARRRLHLARAFGRPGRRCVGRSRSVPKPTPAPGSRGYLTLP